MAANSLPRRLIKRVLYPFASERAYRLMQAASMSWDIASGSWSEPELDLLPHAIHPGDTVLDMGANYGLYVHHISRILRSSGRLYAFEPVPFTFQTLELVSSILRFKNVELVPLGCSDKDGTVTFRLGVQASGQIAAGVATMGDRNDERPGKEKQIRWDATRDVTARVVALDGYLPKVSELSFIKADIEGAELLAFRGASKIIDEHLPTVLCEINPWYLEGFGLRVEDLTAFFLDRGYALYSYDHTAKPARLRPVDPSELIEDNYLFVHPRRKDRLRAVL